MKKKNSVPKRVKAFAVYTPLYEPQPHDARNTEMRDWAWANARALFRIERRKVNCFAGQSKPTPIPAGSAEDRFNQQSEKALRKLFAHMRLDPDDPSSWAVLVNQMAYIFFWEAPRQPRGAPKEWTDEREAELAAAVATLPGMSNVAIARKLANDKKSPFYAKGVDSKAGVEGLRKRLNKVSRAKTAGTK